MKFTKEQLYQLTTIDGGSFQVNHIEEAFVFCKKITTSHYENFPVGSLLIPKDKRNYIYSIYSFARIADDIADEISFIPQNERIQKLNDYEFLLNHIFLKNSEISNPIFLALKNTVECLCLPIEPFKNLLTAFKRDIEFKQPETMEDLFDYCKHSANPVGELILRVFDLLTEQNKKYSDSICTALQLANFWQDFSLDLNQNRLYIPNCLICSFNLNFNNINTINNVRLQLLLNELYNQTSILFENGKLLLKYLKPLRLKYEIAFTIEGGFRILEKTKELGTEIIYYRPKLKFIDYIIILYRCLYKLKK